MPTARRQDLIGRLADLGEDAIQRLSEAPGAERLLQTLNSFRDRLDELQRRVRGLEELERRLAALEKKVDRLSKSGAASARARRGTRAGTSSAGGRSSSAKNS